MTSVTVRAQALGGKFLGKAVCSTPTPALVVLLDGQQVAQGTFTLGNSGKVVASGTVVTPNTITVDANANESVYVPGTYFLEPSGDPAPDSLVTVELPLTGTGQMFEFVVTASNDDTGGTVTASYFASLSSSNVPAAGVVVPVPGLRITNASAVPSNGQTLVTASVAMMCGCAITPVSGAPAEPYWPASEFTVIASAPTSGIIVSVNMVCIGNSIFTTALPSVPTGTPVTIAAVQPDVPFNQNKVVVAAT